MSAPFHVNIIPTTYPARSTEAPADLTDDLSTKPPVSSISISSKSTETETASAVTASSQDDSLSNGEGSKGSKSKSSAYNHLSTKTTTAERLCKAANKSTKKNRSHELPSLTQKYETFCKQFKPFVGALKSYHSSMVQLEKQRSEVLSQIEIFTQNTPLAEAAGKISPIVSANPQSWAKTVANREKTYCAQGQLTHALNTKYAQNVDENCIEYVREWETVVTTRINSSLVKAEDLKKTWKHYEKKVKQLQESESKVAKKGKAPAEKSKDKLSRNKEKLAVAQEDYDKYATTVCHLIDSALDCAWRDMTPLVYRLASMEVDRVGGKDSETIAKSLSELVDNLKAFAQEHKIGL